MKKWVDAHDVIQMVNDIEDHRLRNLEKQMQEKPNFNHNKEKNKKIKQGVRYKWKK